MIFLIILAATALILAGVLNTVETAVSAISRARVVELQREEAPGAQALLQVVDNRARHVNVLVILRTLCESAGAVAVAALCLQWFELRGWAIAAAIGVLTLITFLVVGVFSRTWQEESLLNLLGQCGSAGFSGEDFAAGGNHLDLAGQYHHPWWWL